MINCPNVKSVISIQSYLGNVSSFRVAFGTHSFHFVAMVNKDSVGYKVAHIILDCFVFSKWWCIGMNKTLIRNV